MQEGRALANLPSLPHLNVVGSVVTGTHGGGINNSAMATHVVKVAYVDEEGIQKELGWHHPDFYPFLHTFGTLGIIYEMTMRTEPEYGIKKCIYKDMPWDFLKDRNTFDIVN